jgi:hypothetical protein
MAQYKVIQDIEAEDKLVGPLSLRQFIYAGAAAFLGYLCVISVMNGAAFLLAIFVPPMAFCMFFSWPWSPDQPTEVWALARIRFLFKPRRRVWDQSGVKELVTITVPKKIERIYTDGLSQTEVKSRLGALADTIDSRGWAVKNSALNLSAAPSYVGQVTSSSDRLIDYGSAPQEVPDDTVLASDDMLDEQNNPIAQQFDQLINDSAKKRRTKLVDKLSPKKAAEEPAAKNRTNAQPANDYWFMNQPQGVSAKPTAVDTTDNVVFANAPQITPGAHTSSDVTEPTEQDEAVLSAAHKQQRARDGSVDHLKTIDPAGARPQQPESTSNPDPITLDLARNDDLNVATLARQAKRERHQDDNGEVVISLH